MEKSKLFVIRRKEFDYKKNEWSKSKVVHVFENCQAALDDYHRLCNSEKKFLGISLDVVYFLETYCICSDRPCLAMKKIPMKYKIELSEELRLSSRCDKLGNIFHCVVFCNNDGSKNYFMFSKLSSALDFINSNFI